MAAAPLNRLLALLRGLVLSIPALIVIAAAGGLAWLVLTEGGLEFAATVAGRASSGAVRIEGPRGRLLGPLGFERIEVAAGGDRYLLEDLAIDWSPAELLHGRLEIGRLQIGRIELDTAGETKSALPADLRLPLPVRLAALEIGVVARRGSEGATVLARDIRAALTSDGETHRLDSLEMALDAGRLKAEGTLAGSAPFPVAATLELAATSRPTLSVAARLGGELADMAVDAEGRGEDFSLAARARLAPFAAQPLAALRLKAEGLDPRAFAAAAPRARLALDIDLAPAASGALAGRLRADNATPAPIDRGGLPLARFASALRIEWNDTSRRLVLDDLGAGFGDGGSATGKIDLAWAAAEVLPRGRAELAVKALNPAALHGGLFPARLDGRITFAGDERSQHAVLALADGTRQVGATLDRRGETLEVSGLRLAQGRAELSGNGSFSLSAPYGWRFEAGLRHFDPAAFLAKAPHGDIEALFDGEGTLEPRPAGTLRGKFAPGRLAGQTLQGTFDLQFFGLDRPNDLLVANGRAWLRGVIDLSHGDSRLAARGGWGSPQEKLEVTVAVPELARYRDFAPGVGGAVELTATLGGFPARPELAFDLRARRLALPEGRGAERIDGKGRLAGETLTMTLVAEGILAGATIPRLDFTADGSRSAHRFAATVRLPGELKLSLEAAGGLTEAADWRDMGWNGRIGHLRLDGEWPAVLTAEGELSLSRGLLAGQLTGRIPDLSGLGPALGGGIASAGAIEWDAALAGSPQAPQLRGHVRGRDLAIALLDHGIRLENGELALRFEDERAVLERLAFLAPHEPPARASRIVGKAPTEPGRLSVSGEADIQQRRVRLDATLTRLPLSQRPDRWIVASGTARLEHEDVLLRLGARLAADLGFIAEVAAGRPKLSDDVVVRGRETPPSRPLTLRIETDVGLDLGERFHLRAAGLTARLEGRLRVRGGNAAPLVATGRIEAKDGRFEAYGQRLTVERGIVNFQGPVEDPGLNVLALRKGLPVEAGVSVTGTVQRPVVRLISEPPLPDAEKLSWIVLGRPADASGADASLLLAAAGAIFGGEGEAITDQIAQTLGIDEISLRQAPEGETLSGQILTVGKRLSDRVWLAHEHGLTAGTGVLKLTYMLTPRLSLVTRTGEDNAVDLLFNFRFD